MPQKTLLQSAGDGSAVPAGYVGERLFDSKSQTGIGAGTTTVNLDAGITLTPGIWIAQAHTSGTLQPVRSIEIKITNSANTAISDSDSLNFQTVNSDTSNTANATRINTGLYYFRVAAGSTQVLKAQTVVNFSTSNATVLIYLQAIRIA